MHIQGVVRFRRQTMLLHFASIGVTARVVSSHCWSLGFPSKASADLDVLRVPLIRTTVDSCLVHGLGHWQRLPVLRSAPKHQNTKATPNGYIIFQSLSKVINFVVVPAQLLIDAGCWLFVLVSCSAVRGGRRRGLGFLDRSGKQDCRTSRFRRSGVEHVVCVYCDIG